MPDPGATSERLEALKARWEADRGSRVFLQLADEYRRLGRTEEAARVLEEGLEATPRHTAAQVALGRCQLELGRTEAAVATLEAALEGDPTQMVAYRLLVEAYLAQGKAEEARERLRFYTLLNDADPEIAELRRRIGELDRGGRRPTSRAPDETADETADETRDAGEAADAAGEGVSRVENGLPPGEDGAGATGEAAAPEPAAPEEGQEPGERPADGAPEGSPDASPASPSDPFPDLSDTLYRRRFEEGMAEGDLFAVEPGDRPAEEPPNGADSPPSEGVREGGALRMEDGVAPESRAAAGDLFDLPAPPPPPSQDLSELVGDGGRDGPGRSAEADETRPDPPPPPPPAPGADEAPRPTVTLGRLYLRQGHAEEAEGIFRAVLDRDPGNEEARRHLDELARTPAPAVGAAELLKGYDAGERDGLTRRKRYVLERYLDRLRGRSAHDVR